MILKRLSCSIICLLFLFLCACSSEEEVLSQRCELLDYGLFSYPRYAIMTPLLHVDKKTRDYKFVLKDMPSFRAALSITVLPKPFYFDACDVRIVLEDLETKKILFDIQKNDTVDIHPPWVVTTYSAGMSTLDGYTRFWNSQTQEIALCENGRYLLTVSARSKYKTQLILTLKGGEIERLLKESILSIPVT